MNRQVGLLGLLGLLAGLPAQASDPGLLLELDRQRFEIRVRDLATGAEGPPLRVVLGSPAHPTPAGEFPIYVIVRNPSWEPGPLARSLGAEPVPASSAGPLGIGKIPFAPGGISLHGGADPLLLGKPVSLGCVRATDAALQRLVEWLEERRALQRPSEVATGELHQYFRRPARVRVH